MTMTITPPSPLVARLAADAGEARRRSELCLRRAELAWDRGVRAARHSLQATQEQQQYAADLVAESVELAELLESYCLTQKVKG